VTDPDPDPDPDRLAIAARFERAVNMDADELEAWLETAESRAVGQKKEGAAESIGHASGRASPASCARRHRSGATRITRTWPRSRGSSRATARRSRPTR
jgi:hypothetical protein